MKDDQSLLGGGVNRFQTTRWDVVLLSAQSQTPGCKEALADLCKLYWYPLYSFVRHRGYAPEDAQDLSVTPWLLTSDIQALVFGY